MSLAWNRWLDSIYWQCRELGMNSTREYFSTACHGFFSRPEPVVNESLTVLEKRIFRLLESFNVTFNIEDVRRIALDAVTAWHAEIRIDADAEPVLNYLKELKKKIALVSNFDHPFYLKRLLKENKIESYFDSIVISGEVGVKKPDPAIFNQALETTKLNPEEVVYVGDADEDIAAARAACMLPILIQRNGDKNILSDYLHDQSAGNGPILKEGDDFIKIHRLNQLKEII